LFLWRAESAVVVGKNQNPWRECAADAISREGGQIARRLSGGGTVYHDLGNLNYAWFCTRFGYRSDRVFDALLHAVDRLGVSAHRLGKSSLGVAGRKFSGTAFCFRKNAVMHHGTLLITSDLDRLDRWLRSPMSIKNTRAVASQPAPVVNLSSFGVSKADLEQSIIDSFARMVGDPVEEAPVAAVAVENGRRRFASWEWVFGHTPLFECRIGDLAVIVEKGRVSAVPGDPGRSDLVGMRLDEALLLS
jgi:lipoate-protein ligase A